MAKVINTVLSLRDDFSTTLSKVQKNAEKAVGRIQKAINNAESPTAKLSAGFKAVGAEVTRMGQAFMPVSIAVGGALAACTKSAADFEQAMQNTWSIAKSSNEGSAEAFKVLQDAAKAAGEQGYYSATQAADALGYMALAGWDAEKSAAALPDVLNLAAAAGMELAEASDIVTDYMSAFANTSMTTTQFTDMLSYAQNNANTTVTQLSEAYKNCAANLNAAGQDAYTVTSMLEAMANQGAKGSEAGTKLTAIMRDLTAKMKDGSVQIGDASIAVQDAAGNYRDLTDILRDVDAATQGVGDAERVAALSAVFTQDSISGVNLVLNEGIEKVAGYEDALRNSAGAAADAAAEKQQSLYGALNRLKNQFGTLAVDIGSQFVPILTSLSDKVSAVAQRFNGLSDRTKTAIAIFMAVVAAIGPVLVIVGSVVSAIGAAIPVIAAVGTAVVSASSVIFGAMAGIAAFLLANPIVIAITAIGVAVGVLARYIYKHWDDIKAKFAQVMSTLKQGWESFKLTAVSVWNTVRNTVSSVISTIKATVSSGFNAVKTTIANAVNSAKTTLSSAFTAMENAAAKVVNGIVSKFDSFRSRITSIISSIRSKIESITSIASSVTGLITGHATGTPYFTGGLTRVNEYGGEIINLPSGTQIIPHDLSKKKISGSGVTVNITVQGNLIGNAEYADYLGGMISRRIIAAMNNV